MPPVIPVLTPADAVAWDVRAEAQGISVDTLMDAAGRAAAAVLVARFPVALQAGTLVLAGRGHNGGDGWVLARALHAGGLPVWVAALPGDRAPLTARVAERALRDGVREVAIDGPWPGVGLVVDALLGTGASGAPREPIAMLLDRAHDLTVPLVALDGPTGVDLGTGLVYGTPQAALSITFGGVRRGHLLARDEIGDLAVVDIGLPTPEPGWPMLVTDALAAQWVGGFHGRDHKGDRGRVVICGGAPGMSGAARLAARAAFAAGAGLVYVAAPEESCAVLAAAEPDVQPRVQPIEAPIGSALADLLERADTLVLGPGLGRTPGAAALVRAILEEAPCPILLDADALTVLATQRDLLKRAASRLPIVLTPHPGEFRSLFPECDTSRDTNPWGAAQHAADACGGVVLLKGVPSVVARTGHVLRTIAAGNPGLATGGSGDVLSGLIGAFMGRGDAPDVAAALGAQALGRAADLAARRTSARGLRPMDVVAACRDLWQEWAALRRTPPVPRPPLLFDLLRPRTD